MAYVYHAGVVLPIKTILPLHPRKRIAQYIKYCLISGRLNCAEPWNRADHATNIHHSVSSNSLLLELVIHSDEIRSSTDCPSEEQSQNEVRDSVNQVEEISTSIRDSIGDIALAPSIFAMATPDVYNPGSGAPFDRLATPLAFSLDLLNGQIDNVIAPRHGALIGKDPWVTGVRS